MSAQSLRFISNTYDPSRPDARQYIQTGLHETKQKAWDRYQDWLRGKVIGEPAASDAWSVEKLKENHFVGVYIVEMDVTP